MTRTLIYIGLAAALGIALAVVVGVLTGGRWEIVAFGVIAALGVLLVRLYRYFEG